MDNITLTLTELEAKTLHMILNRVGGHPATTLRGSSEAIRTKLCEAIPDPEADDVFWNESQATAQGAVYFNPASLNLF